MYMYGRYVAVSQAAVFWMSRNTPPFLGGALRDIQKPLRGRLYGRGALHDTNV